MSITKPVTQTRIFSIRHLQQFIALILLLCFVCIAFSPFNFQAQSFEDYSGHDSPTYWKPDKGTKEKGGLKKFFSIIENVLEEDIEKFTDDWLPPKSLLKTLDTDNTNFDVQSCTLTRQCHAFYKDWCASKRLAILTSFASLRLSLYHILKLPG